MKEKIYLDVSCLNRPYDDQTQVRVRLEAEAVSLIFDKFATGLWRHVSSEMALIELQEMKSEERRQRLLMHLPRQEDILVLSESVVERARELFSWGLGFADAVHVAAAEFWEADVFLTCDDRLLRRAGRMADRLRVRVANPVKWLEDQGYAFP